MTNWNDGTVHGWNGGDCPVHPKTVVKYWTNSGEKSPHSAKCLRWKHTDEGLGDIIAFRVIKEYVEPKVIWVNEYEDGEHMAFETEADARARVGNGKTRIAVKYVEVKE